MELTDIKFLCTKNNFAHVTFQLFSLHTQHKRVVKSWASETHMSQCEFFSLENPCQFSPLSSSIRDFPLSLPILINRPNESFKVAHNNWIKTEKNRFHRIKVCNWTGGGRTVSLWRYLFGVSFDKKFILFAWNGKHPWNGDIIALFEWIFKAHLFGRSKVGKNQPQQQQQPQKREINLHAIKILSSQIAIIWSVG